MLRRTLRIPFHVPEHKGFFVKLLFILDSPTFSGRSDPLHQFEVLAAVARVKRPDKGNVCSPPKCNKKVVCPRGSEQTTAQRRKRMAKVRRHLWPLPLPGADRGRLPAVQRGPIRFVDAEEEVELTLADGEPVGRVHRGHTATFLLFGSMVLTKELQ